MPSVPIEIPSLTPMVLNREPNHARRLDTFLDFLAQSKQGHVAGIALKPDTGDSDLRHLHIGFFHARCIEHGLRGTLRFLLSDV